jgi:hypothetical protein
MWFIGAAIIACTLLGLILVFLRPAEAQQPGRVHRVALVFTTAPVAEMKGLILYIHTQSGVRYAESTAEHVLFPRGSGSWGADVRCARILGGAIISARSVDGAVIGALALTIILAIVLMQ